MYARCCDVPNPTYDDLENPEPWTTTRAAPAPCPPHARAAPHTDVSSDFGAFCCGKILPPWPLPQYLLHHDARACHEVVRRRVRAASPHVEGVHKSCTLWQHS